MVFRRVSPGRRSLKLAAMRSAVAANSYQKYVTATLANGCERKDHVFIMENKDLYPGVDVEEDSGPCL